MSKVNEIIKQIDHLTDEECKQVLDHLKDRLDTRDALVLGKSYDWWNTKEDDIYSE